MNLEDVYNKIAKTYGVSVEEVKRDMQDAIDHIDYEGKSPTPEEFIKEMIEKIIESE